MTPIQEAYALMQRQSDGNIRLIVQLLQKMSPTAPQDRARPIQRTGTGKGMVEFPADFDEHFDDLNAEIAELFNGGAV